MSALYSIKLIAFRDRASHSLSPCLMELCDRLCPFAGIGECAITKPRTSRKDDALRR